MLLQQTNIFFFLLSEQFYLKKKKKSFNNSFTKLSSWPAGIKSILFMLPGSLSSQIICSFKHIINKLSNGDNQTGCAPALARTLCVLKFPWARDWAHSYLQRLRSAGEAASDAAGEHVHWVLKKERKYAESTVDKLILSSFKLVQRKPSWASVSWIFHPV